MASTIQVQQLRGIGLPALRTAGGYFAVKNRQDKAWSDLLVAVLTPIGSRPMNRGFGSALHDVLFEQAGGQVEQLVDYVIRQAVSAYAPHVVIVGVKARSVGNEIKVLIRFSLADDRAVLEKPLLISKSDVVNLLAASRRARS